MVEFNKGQRELLAEKLADTANLVAGALIFGPFLSGTGFSIAAGAAGFGIWFSLLAFSTLLKKEDV